MRQFDSHVCQQDKALFPNTHRTRDKLVDMREKDVTIGEIRDAKLLRRAYNL